MSSHQLKVVLWGEAGLWAFSSQFFKHLEDGYTPWWRGFGGHEQHYCGFCCSPNTWEGLDCRVFIGLIKHKPTPSLGENEQALEQALQQLGGSLDWTGWGQQVSITLLKNLDLKENLKNQLETDVKINLLSYKYLPRLFWAYSLPLSLHVLSQLWPHVTGSEMSWCLIYISLAIAWQKSLADGKVIGQTDRIFHLRELECEAHFVEAERGQLSHELAPELLLGHQHRAVWNH